MDILGPLPTTDRGKKIRSGGDGLLHEVGGGVRPSRPSGSDNRSHIGEEILFSIWNLSSITH